jgi:hypothetical protein
MAKFKRSQNSLVSVSQRFQNLEKNAQPVKETFAFKNNQFKWDVQ